VGIGYKAKVALLGLMALGLSDCSDMIRQLPEGLVPYYYKEEDKRKAQENEWAWKEQQNKRRLALEMEKKIGYLDELYRKGEISERKYEKLKTKTILDTALEIGKISPERYNQLMRPYLD